MSAAAVRHDSRADAFAVARRCCVRRSPAATRAGMCLDEEGLRSNLAVLQGRMEAT